MFFALLAAVNVCNNVPLPTLESNPAGSAVFAPGVISTGALEYAITFTPDCKTAFFSRREGDWGRNSGQDPRIFQSHWQEDRWSDPTPVSFSSNYGDDAPFVTPDGKHLYFVSNRPKAPGATKDDYDIWRVSRLDDDWGKAEHLPEPVNSSEDEDSPVLGLSGNIFFSSTRKGGFGQGDIYKAKANGTGGYTVEHLSDAINSSLGEWNVGINPDETILLFEASQREENISSYGDLYISYRANSSEQWSKAKPIAAINTAGSNLMPRFSPDGEYLFYGNTDSLDDRDANILYSRTATLLDPDQTKQSLIAIANRSEHVISIVDANSYKEVAKVSGGKGPHEVTALKNTGFATASFGIYNDIADVTKQPRQLKFRSDPSEGITVYNVAEGKTKKVSIDTCARPHGIASNPDGSLLWVTCQVEQSVVEIDTVTGLEIRRWDTGQNGSHIVIYDKKRNRLYVANVDAGSVTLIDRATNNTRIINTGAGAEGLAITDSGDKLWVTNTQDDTISVIALDRDEVVKTFKSGGQFPVKPRSTPDGKEVWVTHNNSHELSVFDAHSMKSIATINLESAPLGLLIAPSGKKVFVTLPRLDRIDVFDAKTKKRVDSFFPGTEPDGMAWVEFD